MDLDSRQTRQLFLAGTVAFPTPFPSVGAISFSSGNLTNSPGARGSVKNLVVVQSFANRSCTTAHAALLEDVAAIFIPGSRQGNGEFHNVRTASVDDLDDGEWFVDSDINPESIRSRLGLADGNALTSRESSLRGIIFVREHCPVISNTEVITTAAAIRDIAITSDCLGGGP